MIAPWIEKEEQQFFKVMETGYGRLAEKLEQCRRRPGSRCPASSCSSCTTPTASPSTSARRCARSRAYEVLRQGFEREMEAQKERARGAAKFDGDMGEQETHGGDAEFAAATQTLAAQARVLAIEPRGRHPQAGAAAGAVRAATRARARPARDDGSHAVLCAVGRPARRQAAAAQRGQEYACQATPVKRRAHRARPARDWSVGDSVDAGRGRRAP